jgi:hypothetical protein
MSRLENIYSVTDLFTNDPPFHEKKAVDMDKEKLDTLVDFQLIDAKIVIAVKQLEAKKITADKLDSYIGPELHYTLRNVYEQILNNDGFWTWLALIRLRTFSDLRAKTSDSSEYKPQQWIGNSALRAQSRHVLRRVFNVCDVLVDKRNVKETFKKSTSRYADCMHILRVQDAIQQIGDRTLSFNHSLIKQQLPTLIKIIKTSKGDKKKKIQALFNRLNALSTTRLFSYLDKDELKKL